MTDQFDAPGALDSIKWADYEHRLVLITPHRVERDVPKMDGNGVRDVTHGDVVVLDGPGAPEVFRPTPIFPAYLQAHVRALVGTGRSVLGRVGRDPGRANKGQQAPWVLGAPSETDKQIARDYLARQAGGRLSPAGGGRQEAPTAPPSDAPPF